MTTKLAFPACPHHDCESDLNGEQCGPHAFCQCVMIVTCSTLLPDVWGSCCLVSLVSASNAENFDRIAIDTASLHALACPAPMLQIYDLKLCKFVCVCARLRTCVCVYAYVRIVFLVAVAVFLLFLPAFTAKFKFWGLRPWSRQCKMRCYALMPKFIGLQTSQNVQRHSHMNMKTYRQRVATMDFNLLTRRSSRLFESHAVPNPKCWPSP